MCSCEKRKESEGYEAGFFCFMWFLGEGGGSGQLCQATKSFANSGPQISRTLYPISSSPLNTNSNRVRRFSGEGAETKMLEYPSASAPAMASPRAADCRSKMKRGCEFC